jgi:hypothetical protein
MVALGLHDTHIDIGSGCCQGCSNDRHEAETVVELMKLGCKRSNPDDMRTVENQLLNDQRDLENGITACLLKQRYTEWHLVITGGALSVDRFIKKVSSLEFRHQILASAEAHLDSLATKR